MSTGARLERSREEAAMAGEENGTLRITWEEPRGFIGLSLKIALLSLLTLGLYAFWGKVEVRRRIWHAIRVNGEPLEYTGTGKELLLGFLLAVGLLLVGVIAYSVIMLALFGDTMLARLMDLPLYALLFWLTGLAIYRARRYRLRRTQWRGIRGTMSGSPARFANTWFATALLVPLSLGWALPWRQVKLYRILTNETRVGTTPLRFAKGASASALYPPFALVWFAIFMVVLLLAGAVIVLYADISRRGEGLVLHAIPTSAKVYGAFALLLALAAIYLLLRYHAHRLNWMAGNTFLQDGHFTLNFQAGDLFRLVVGNALILLLSLGVLLPVVQKRLVRHFVRYLGFEGTVDLAAITQAGDTLEKTGEGLAEAFDIDAF